MANNDPDQPENDSPLAIGLTGILGAFWWYTLFFVYVPNKDYIQTTTGSATEPIAWFWVNLSNSLHGWTAAAYLCSFILYLMTSVVEVIGYAMYLTRTP